MPTDKSELGGNLQSPDTQAPLAVHENGNIWHCALMGRKYWGGKKKKKKEKKKRERERMEMLQDRGVDDSRRNAEIGKSRTELVWKE